MTVKSPIILVNLKDLTLNFTGRTSYHVLTLIIGLRHKIT